METTIPAGFLDALSASARSTEMVRCLVYGVGRIFQGR
jgi:hypothetical protein